MEELRLLHPLWLIPAIVFFLLAFFVNRNVRTDDWQQVISKSVLRYLRTSKDAPRVGVNYVLLAAAVCSLALSSPAIRGSTDEALLHSTNWLVLLDVSRSMTTTDIAPSRLSAARNTLLQLSKEANSRALGLIVYAGDAFLASPPAFDKRQLEETAALLDHGIVPHEGSNLSRALSLATAVVTDSQLIDGRIFLLTDSGGVNNTTEAAARFLHSQGQQLDIVVFGSTDGDPNIAVNQSQVEALAAAGGGKSIKASNFGEVDLDAFNLSDAQSSEFFSADLSSLQWKNQSHWIVLLLLPLLIQLFRSENKR